MTMRVLAAVAAFALATCAARAEEPAACEKVGVLDVSVAAIPGSVWSSQPGWSARLAFAIDPQTGAPMGLAVTDFDQRVKGGRGPFVDEATLRRIATDTINRFRFCVPAGSDPGVRYVLSLRFTPIPDKGLYVQSFEPAYTRDEIDQRRTGTVRVVTEFDVDGRAAKADVRGSSGDDVLDRKAVQASLTNRLIAEHGLPLVKPLFIEQPYNFQLK